MKKIDSSIIIKDLIKMSNDIAKATRIPASYIITSEDQARLMSGKRSRADILKSLESRNKKRKLKEILEYK